MYGREAHSLVNFRGPRCPTLAWRCAAQDLTRFDGEELQRTVDAGDVSGVRPR